MTNPAETHTDLLVVGCGPAGVAALFHAAMEGIEALGVDAGPTPLASISDYIEGLFFISGPREYQVASLPLDCRDPNQMTREDVLYYYGRVINYGRLKIRCHTRCTELTPRDGGVCIGMQTPSGGDRIVAKNVIVTSWFEKQPVPEELEAAQVPIYQTVQNGITVANRRTVIVGGGLSGFEQAVVLMMQGQAITLLCRHGFAWYHRNKRFRALVFATGSTVVARAENISSIPGEVTYDHDGIPKSAPCDAIITCIGNRPSEQMLRVLVEADVLSPEERDLARAAQGAVDISRSHLELNRKEAFDRAVRGWPDFWAHLFEGRNGVRFAGAILHPGGRRAGTMTSIHTAKLAVSAIAGHDRPSTLAPPLPKALAARKRSPHWSAPEAFDLVAPLRPMTIGAWSRHWPSKLVYMGENASGAVYESSLAEGASQIDTKYLLGDCRDELIDCLLEASTGAVTVQGLIDEAARAGHTRDDVIKALDRLWKSNILTWLPPPEGLGPRQPSNAGE